MVETTMKKAEMENQKMEQKATEVIMKQQKIAEINDYNNRQKAAQKEAALKAQQQQTQLREQLKTEMENLLSVPVTPARSKVNKSATKSRQSKGSRIGDYDNYMNDGIEEPMIMMRPNVASDDGQGLSGVHTGKNGRYN